MSVVAVDTFANVSPGTESPFEHVAVVTPSDTDDLANATRGISITAAAAVKVNTVGGETVTIPSGALVAGQIHWLRVTRVWATGTGTTTVVAYW